MKNMQKATAHLYAKTLIVGVRDKSYITNWTFGLITEAVKGFRVDFTAI